MRATASSESDVVKSPDVSLCCRAGVKAPSFASRDWEGVMHSRVGESVGSLYASESLAEGSSSERMSLEIDANTWSSSSRSAFVSNSFQ